MGVTNLEKTIEEKVKPLVADAMQKFLGVTVSEIEHDISGKLKRSPLLDYDVDVTKPFKQAKLDFKRYYLTRLLQNHFGNVSEVARIANLDRRSIHRLITALKIDVRRFRQELLRGEYVKQEAVKDIIQQTLDSYKQSLNPDKLALLYRFAPTLSKDIVAELPEAPLTLDQAEAEFERKYFAKALALFNNNISKTARAIGIRYETLHRKLKMLGAQVA
ncbi:MAG TPA: helix-turn-helix domain-containing protein [Candidatus Binatia bacterium]|nr:helix-turn-helix domain-containing protein [Candidatus Binatia bacterium]